MVSSPRTRHGRHGRANRLFTTPKRRLFEVEGYCHSFRQMLHSCHQTLNAKRHEKTSKTDNTQRIEGIQRSHRSIYQKNVNELINPDNWQGDLNQTAQGQCSNSPTIAILAFKEEKSS